MKYYKVQSLQDFKFLSNLFTKKNYKFIETPSISAKQVREKSKKADRNDYILMVNNKKMGWFCITLSADKKQARFGIILSLFYQGKGYGRQAMKLIEKEAKKLGAKKLKLEVLENNNNALKLYLKSGFREKHRLIVMEKRIN